MYKRFRCKLSMNLQTFAEGGTGDGGGAGAFLSSRAQSALAMRCIAVEATCCVLLDKSRRKSLPGGFCLLGGSKDDPWRT